MLKPAGLLHRRKADPLYRRCLYIRPQFQLPRQPAGAQEIRGRFASLFPPVPPGPGHPREASCPLRDGHHLQAPRGLSGPDSGHRPGLPVRILRLLLCGENAGSKTGLKKKKTAIVKHGSCLTMAVFSPYSIFSQSRGRTSPVLPAACSASSRKFV